MQGEADRQRELLDVKAVAGHLLPAGRVFAFQAEHRSRLFPASMFADLFPSGRGRPSIPPEVVASVIVLQTLHGYSDREPLTRSPSTCGGRRRAGTRSTRPDSIPRR